MLPIIFFIFDNRFERGVFLLKNKIALGKEKADLVLKNCIILDVFTQSVEVADIAIQDDLIIGIGKYDGLEEIQVNHNYVSPGFIDGHVHIESSMLSVKEFSKIVLEKGTTSVIADPHEIANVLGIDGVRYMIECAMKSPLGIHYMIPSCVPATSFESNGGVIGLDEVKALKDNFYVSGLGEVMDYNGVILGDLDIHSKINMLHNKTIDGHAPGVKGKELNSYVLAGVKTDHECTNVQEMTEKLRRGMYIHLREGSATRNVKDLVKGVTPSNSSRLMFCTDDKHPYDIVNEGHINYNINIAIENGVDPIRAITMATINIANCYNLKNLGAIAPGYKADLVIFDDINNINPHTVIKDGKVVVNNSELCVEVESHYDKKVYQSVNVNSDRINFDIPLESNEVKLIEIVKQNILTKMTKGIVNIKDGLYVNNRDLDILKIGVIERHKGTNEIGLGLLKGYGLKNGAIALSIAHDSHNIIVVGDNDNDMRLAVNEIIEMQGGISIVSENTVVDSLQLEVAGLMTNKSSEYVASKLINLEKHAHNLEVVEEIDPFVTLAFLSLPVIPEVKLTTKSLFDVQKFEYTSLLWDKSE